MPNATEINSSATRIPVRAVETAAMVVTTMPIVSIIAPTAAVFGCTARANPHR